MENNTREVKPVIAVSSCLMGREVRFDGGHKHNRYVTQVLSAYFDFRPICPEMGIGLGVPRPTIRLESGAEGQVIARSNAESAEDYTQALKDYADQMVPSLAGVCGYILKKDSPSCGMERVKVYEGENKPPERRGQGIYAAAVMQACPNLPVEEEGRLMDPRLRENFVERIFLFATWQNMMADGITPRDLVAFHTAHKFAILAHDEPGYRRLGQIVAQAGSTDIDSCAAEYLALLMQSMKKLSTPGKHANVLMHIMGYFKESLSASDKQELLRLIDAHREGLVPVIVPITLINYFRRKYPNKYIDGQTYLEPHPPELMLRNTL